MDAVQPFLNDAVDILADPSEVSGNIRIGNTNHRHSEFLQIFRANLVGTLILRLIVLRTVQLNHEFRFGTIEIHNESSKDSLSTEFGRMMPQIIIPEMPFFLRHFPSEISRIVNQFTISSVVHKSHLPHLAHAKQGRLFTSIPTH